METGDFNHLSVETVVKNMMLHSTSPQARKLAESLLTDDPFNPNVKLDDNARNRNAEILNVFLKTMGLRIKFIKRKIELKEVVKIHPVRLKAKLVKESVITPVRFYGKNELIQVVIIDKDKAGLQDTVVFHPVSFVNGGNND